MPLLDHFHPPLLGQRHWDGIYGVWAVALADALNAILPRDYFAEFRKTLGTRIETEVATFTEGEELTAPAAVVPTPFPDDIAVEVFSTSAGPTLVAAIELVSPRNKDCPEARQAFAAKCSAYLQRGIGLIVVDIVTSRRANLHDDLGTLLGHAHGFAFPEPTALYATAFRPAHRQERNEMDVWREMLAVGQPPPTLPLAVRGLRALPIDLEATYTEARQRGRIG